MSDYTCKHGAMAMGRYCPKCNEEKVTKLILQAQAEALEKDKHTTSASNDAAVIIDRDRFSREVVPLVPNNQHASDEAAIIWRLVSICCSHGSTGKHEKTVERQTQKALDAIASLKERLSKAEYENQQSKTWIGRYVSGEIAVRERILEKERDAARSLYAKEQDMRLAVQEVVERLRQVDDAMVEAAAEAYWNTIPCHVPWAQYDNAEGKRKTRECMRAALVAALGK